MSSSHIVLPLDQEMLEMADFITFIEYQLIFLPSYLPHGRLPTISQLRHVIHDLGYQVKEQGNDWEVTSDDDWTSIWLGNEDHEEDSTVGISFRRGYHIVYNIMQSLTNHLGCYFVIFANSGVPVLTLPNQIFPLDSGDPISTDFFTMMIQRLPFMINRLPKASEDETLLILSQICQTMRAEWGLPDKPVSQAVAKLPFPTPDLLNNPDDRIRKLAFEIRLPT
jgi:hypothetical protein